MKTIIIKWTLGVLILLSTGRMNAQDELVSLEQARLQPYKLEVTYNKTTHLLFPSPIKYVDLGSENLVANKTEAVANVLRIKSATKDFEDETNFSVITEDGKFYNFDVYYSTYPTSLNYDLVKLQREIDKTYSTDVLFEDLKGSSSELTDQIMKTLYHNSKRTVKHIGSKSFGIQLSLRSLYVYEGKFYFIIHIKNSSNIAYHIDQINFKIVDKKNLKRTVVQDKTLAPLRNYSPLTMVEQLSDVQGVYLLDQFTLLDDQVMILEVFEKDGGRHQKIEIENSDLINAKIVQDIHLKLK